MDGWCRLMYVLSSRDSLPADGDKDEDEDGVVEEEEAMDGEAAGDRAGERAGVAGLAERSWGEAVGETASCGGTTCGAIGLRVSHISHVERVPALWKVQVGHIHSAEEADEVDEAAVGEGEGGGCGDGARMVVADVDEWMGRAAVVGEGRGEGEGAGDAERGRGVLHASHIVRAAMLTNVHMGHAHSPLDDMLLTQRMDSSQDVSATAYVRALHATPASGCR